MMFEKYDGWDSNYLEPKKPKAEDLKIDPEEVCGTLYKCEDYTYINACLDDIDLNWDKIQHLATCSWLKGLTSYLVLPIDGRAVTLDLNKIRNDEDVDKKKYLSLNNKKWLTIAVKRSTRGIAADGCNTLSEIIKDHKRV